MDNIDESEADHHEMESETPAPIEVLRCRQVERVISDHLLMTSNVNEEWISVPLTNMTDAESISPPNPGSTDLIASGDSSHVEPLSYDQLALRLQIHNVASGYLGSNEAGSSSSSSSSLSGTSSTIRQRRANVPNTNNRVHRLSENSELHSIPEIMSGNMAQSSIGVMDQPLNQDPGFVASPTTQIAELETDVVETPTANAVILSMQEDENLVQTGVEVVVNSECGQNWNWDQQLLTSPASVVDDEEGVPGPNFVSYLQQILHSVSEEIFIRPSTRCLSADSLNKSRGFRSTSCNSFFTNKAVKLSHFLAARRRQPLILHFEMQYNIDANVLKRSKSFDIMKNTENVELNSKGDYNRSQEFEKVKMELRKPDSGKSTPDGSSERSRRIDDLLGSLLALVSAEKLKSDEQTGSSNNFSTNFPDAGADNVSEASNLTSEVFTASQPLHEDNLRDLREYVNGIRNLELPWDPNQAPKEMFTPNFKLLSASLPEVSARAHSSGHSSYTCVDNQEGKFLNCVKETKILDPQNSESITVQELKNMASKIPTRSKTVKFSNTKCVQPEQNQNYLVESSSSQESIDLNHIPARFRESREFTRKEELLRSRSESSDFEEGSRSLSRGPRSVTFCDTFCPKYESNIEATVVSSDEALFLKSSMSNKSRFLNLPSTPSETLQVRMDLDDRNNLIEDSVDSLEELLNNLQKLWLNVNEGGKIPTLPPSMAGEHRLSQLTSLCSFIVKEMESDWHTFEGVNPVDTQNLSNLQESNRCLKQQLESCKLIQSCLESEITYVGKEKALLNEEVKHLSLHLAKLESQLGIAKKSTSNHEFHFDSSCDDSKICQPAKSCESMGFTVTSTEDNVDLMHFLPGKSCLKLQARPSTSPPTFGKNCVQKREDDFNSIMEFFQKRGSDINYYQEQLEKYDMEVSDLKRQVEITSAERQEMKNAYDTLQSEHKALVKERSHYEGVLKLILQEKQTNDHSLQDLMEILIQKLNCIAEDSDGCSNSKLNLLESALQAVQLQNAHCREEIDELKNELKSSNEEKSELESNNKTNERQIEELTNQLQLKAQAMTDFEKCMADKLTKLEELHAVVAQANCQLEKALQSKEEELKKIQETMATLQKNGLRQQKKIHEFQKVNTRLIHDINEQKNNMEALNNIVHQLRSNLKEQKTQWAERLKASGDEATQSKDHCKWLQSQVEHLNVQLKDAHERMKAHEIDKSSLAQQVLTAEEERKLIDRRFQELRAAMAGDLVLRQALAERNEALQGEITRMRRAKLINLGKSLTTDTDAEESGFETPPSEMNNLDSLTSILPPALYYTTGDKGLTKKNRYTTATYANTTTKRPKESPRKAISLHTGGAKVNGN